MEIKEENERNLSELINLGYHMWHNHTGNNKKTRVGCEIHFLKYHWYYLIYIPFIGLSSSIYPQILDNLILPSSTLFSLYDSMSNLCIQISPIKLNNTYTQMDS